MNNRILVYFLLCFFISTSACTQLTKPNVFEPSWMSYDAAKKQVHFELVAAWSANNNGYNFNGYIEDELSINVPPDWDVTMTLINLDGNAPHSIVMTEPYTDDDMPDELTGEFAIFERAYTDEAYANESMTMSFKPTVGDYWVFCGVKSHGVNGMWVKFTVDAKINTPMIEIKENLIGIRR